MSKKVETFKAGDKVTVCSKAMKDGNKASQLMNHTGLSAEELRDAMDFAGPTADGQIKVKHPRLMQAFKVHPKFMTRHTGTAPTSASPQ